MRLLFWGTDYTNHRCFLCCYMNAVSLNNLWSYLQGLSLSASNQRWLGERLIEASATHATAISEEELKLKKLNALFGVWNGQEGELI